MSLLRRLFNVARGKVLAGRAEPPPEAPEEAPRPAVKEEEPPPREEAAPRDEGPAEPRQRRL